MIGQNTGNRMVVLDTETTGLDPTSGHRIIEIGCVELRERRLTGNNLHIYLQPDREIDPGAMAVHGISNEFLADKPRFASVSARLRDYLVGAELIIHNADFDVGFIEHEFRLCNEPLVLSEICRVTDTLALARTQFPGQRNSLDALCKRLGVNNAHRTLHGALLDSEILADVYLVMTGGQTDLSLDQDSQGGSEVEHVGASLDVSRLRLLRANSEELKAHEHWLEKLRKADDGCAWDRLPGSVELS
ncbi:MAG: DNA polymerase III subunit epsilon [Granulosicoccus sp.]|nr:DNA polymerase III subunit epsilon [Granulosicoccus sp.]